MTIKRGGSVEPQSTGLRVLPFCAKCKYSKRSWLHSKTKDGRLNPGYHEFEPCVSLKEVEDFAALKMLEVAKQKDEQWKKRFKERDERLAKGVREIVVEIRKDMKHYLVEVRDQPLFYKELMGEFGRVDIGLSRLEKITEELRK